MYWIDDDGGSQRAAAASGKSGVRKKETQEREAPTAGPQADSTGPYKDPQIVRDFSRPSNKPSISIIVHRRAHGYNLNALFPHYLN